MQNIAKTNLKIPHYQHQLRLSRFILQNYRSSSFPLYVNIFLAIATFTRSQKL